HVIKRAGAQFFPDAFSDDPHVDVFFIGADLKLESHVATEQNSVGGDRMAGLIGRRRNRNPKARSSDFNHLPIGYRYALPARLEPIICSVIRENKGLRVPANQTVFTLESPFAFYFDSDDVRWCIRLQHPKSLCRAKS